MLLLCPISFGLLCTNFHLFQRFFWFFLDLIVNPFIVNLLLLIHCLVTCYLTLCLCVFFSFFFSCDWFIVSCIYGQKRCLLWFKSSIYWDLFCVLPYGLSYKLFNVHLKRMYSLLFWGEMLWRYQLHPSDLRILFPCWLSVSKISHLMLIRC